MFLCKTLRLRVPSRPSWIKIVATLLLLVGCQRAGEATGPLVVIDAPPSGARIPTGREVEIVSTATDAAGVQRIELYINGDLIAETRSPLAEGQHQLSAVQRWVPIAPGPAEVTVYGWNMAGTRSRPAAILLDVEGPPLLPTAAAPTPTATLAPDLFPTAVLSPTLAPTLVIEGQVSVEAGLNVRDRPDLAAPRLGGLARGNAVTAIARNAAGDWAKIRFGPANGTGWVVAAYVTWQGDLLALPVE